MKLMTIGRRTMSITRRSVRGAARWRKEALSHGGEKTAFMKCWRKADQPERLIVGTLRI